MEQQFFQLFRSLDRAYGSYKITHKQGVKVKGQAITQRGVVNEELWKKHLSGKQGLGLVPILGTKDARCWWGAIDIDKYDIDLVDLEKQIDILGLPLIVCRTKSGGAHLYIFAKDKPIPAEIIRSKLMEWSGALGHPGVEVFPKQNSLANDHDVGNWINMPYFNVEKTERYAIFHGKKLEAKDFLEYAQHKAIDIEKLVQFELEQGEEFRGAPPCLQALIRMGFPKGSRNNALMNLGVFAKLKYGDDWEQKVDEYNVEYMTPGSSQEVQNVIKSLKKKEYKYMCDKQPIVTCCNRELCRQREFGIGGADEPPLYPDSVIKMLSEPPVYFVSVSGFRIALSSDDLIMQQKFNKIVFQRLNYLAPMVKAGKWRNKLNELMQDVEEVDAPEDAGPEGQFKHHLEQFCTSKLQARIKDDILNGKVWTDRTKQRHYFRSSDLLKYLTLQKFMEFKPREIWTILKEACEAEYNQFKIKGKNVRCWSIPLFQEQTEEFDVPKVQQEF